MSLDLGGYVVDADRYCWTLQRKVVRTKKTGEEYAGLALVGYYSDLSNLARKLAALEARTAVANGYPVGQVVAAIAFAADRIEKALRPVLVPIVHPDQQSLDVEGAPV